MSHKFKIHSFSQRLRYPERKMKPDTESTFMSILLTSKCSNQKSVRDVFGGSMETSVAAQSYDPPVP